MRDKAGPPGTGAARDVESGHELMTSLATINIIIYLLRSSRKNLGGPSAIPLHPALPDDVAPGIRVRLCGFIYKIIINYSVAYYYFFCVRTYI